MKETILALLIAQFSGVRKDGLNQLARTMALQVTTEDEAKALCSKLTKAQVDDGYSTFVHVRVNAYNQPFFHISLKLL